MVSGNNDEYFRHNADLLARGRAINALDVSGQSHVCLVDGGAARTLFFGEDPMGQTLYLGGFEYTVVGTINEDEDSSLFSQILLGGNTGRHGLCAVYVGQEDGRHVNRGHGGGVCHRSG